MTKYILGEATPGERDKVERWKVADVENSIRYEQFSLIWRESRKFIYTGALDEKEAVIRLREKIELNQKPVRRIIYSSLKWLRVAAVFVLLLGIAAGTYFQYIKRHKLAISMIQLSPGNKSFSGNLPDGSAVKLAKNSTLIYPSVFESNQRNVRLSGECIFTIKPDIGRPFVLYANNVVVKVLGTMFLVRATNGKTEIEVMFGMVRVIKGVDSVQLDAGQKLSVLVTDTSLVSKKEYGEIHQPVVAKKVIKPKIHPLPIDTSLFARKAVIRGIILELIQEQIVPNRDSIHMFMLSDKELILNQQKEPEDVFERYKKKYLTDPRYWIYYGDVRPAGEGIFLKRGTL